MEGGSLVLLPSTQARGVAHGAGVEMDDLARGMNPRVGATGANGNDGMARDETDGSFNRVLHRHRVRL